MRYCADEDPSMELTFCGKRQCWKVEGKLIQAKERLCPLTAWPPHIKLSKSTIKGIKLRDRDSSPRYYLEGRPLQMSSDGTSVTYPLSLLPKFNSGSPISKFEISDLEDGCCWKHFKVYFAELTISLEGINHGTWTTKSDKSKSTSNMEAPYVALKNKLQEHLNTIRNCKKQALTRQKVFILSNLVGIIATVKPLTTIRSPNKPSFFIIYDKLQMSIKVKADGKKYQFFNHKGESAGSMENTDDGFPKDAVWGVTLRGGEVNQLIRFIREDRKDHAFFDLKQNHAHWEMPEKNKWWWPFDCTIVEVEYTVGDVNMPNASRCTII